MSDRPSNPDPKFPLALSLADARVALEAASSAVYNARFELSRLEKQAETALMTDADVRDLLADYAVNRLARSLHLDEHGFGQDQPPEVERAWSELVSRGHEIENKLRSVGDLLQRAREERNAAAKKGVAA